MHHKDRSTYVQPSHPTNLFVIVEVVHQRSQQRQLGLIGFSP
jgi:hypothetical protein